MKHSKSIVFLFLFLILGCGRKQKGIFDFPEKFVTEEIKVNRIALGFVRGLIVKKKSQGILISWKEPLSGDYKDKLIGYNIYRLVNSIFVPKKPINKSLIKTTEFFDDLLSETKNKNCYLVRPVFKINSKKIEGFSSQIVCLK